MYNDRYATDTLPGDNIQHQEYVLLYILFALRREEEELEIGDDDRWLVEANFKVFLLTSPAPPEVVRFPLSRPQIPLGDYHFRIHTPSSA